MCLVSGSSDSLCIGSKSIHRWAISLIVIFVVLFVVILAAIIYTRCKRQKEEEDEVSKIVMPLTLQSSILESSENNRITKTLRKSNRMSNHEMYDDLPQSEQSAESYKE